ncbi:MAG: NUDIX hydrolase [Chlamydiae bacterium]|jgi:ADP-ribose pyrophosphatase|nr:NUDIX hydrolase [Chlamydiota bacterium]
MKQLLIWLIMSTICAEDSISQYLKFLSENEVVLGKKGNFKLGEIEIVTDPSKIKEIEKLQKARCLKQGMKNEEALLASKIGVIADDLYWVFLRDAVIFPTGAEGAYNRLIWKSSLDKGPSGVAILPMLPDKKVAAIIAFRHATRVWELEIPRGVRQTSEEVENALKRELEEETGFLAKETHFLGEMAPDPGMASTLTPVYLAKIDKQGLANQDYSEAILGVRIFTISEIKQALIRGYIEVDIKGRKEKVFVRDSYLTYALFLAECKGMI